MWKFIIVLLSSLFLCVCTNAQIADTRMGDSYRKAKNLIVERFGQPLTRDDRQLCWHDVVYGNIKWNCLVANFSYYHKKKVLARIALECICGSKEKALEKAEEVKSKLQDYSWVKCSESSSNEQIVYCTLVDDTLIALSLSSVSDSKQEKLTLTYFYNKLSDNF